MPKFEIVTGKSTISPEDAAEKAEKKAERLRGEMISISTCVLYAAAPAASTEELAFLNNIAINIAKLLKCECNANVRGDLAQTPDQPPSFPTLPSPAPAAAIEWVVQILVRRR